MKGIDRIVGLLHPRGEKKADADLLFDEKVQELKADMLRLNALYESRKAPPETPIISENTEKSGVLDLEMASEPPPNTRKHATLRETIRETNGELTENERIWKLLNDTKARTILLRLGRFPSTAATLTENMKITPPTTTRILEEIDALGWLTKQKDRSHKTNRVKGKSTQRWLYDLTEDGKTAKNAYLMKKRGGDANGEKEA